jgi:mRNA-degrading endonuclease RelE of RelBE toxin-antitoxin system
MFKVTVGPRAEKDLSVLDKGIVHRIRDRLKELVIDPFSPRISRPLKMFAGLRSARVGDWRIIFEVIEDRQTIEVKAIRPRSRVYNEL